MLPVRGWKRGSAVSEVFANSVNLFLPLVAAVALDWLIMGRIAALAPSVAYRYRPTIWRYAALLISTLWFTHAGDVLKPWYASSAVGVTAIVLYVALVMVDVFSQRTDRTGENQEDRYDF